MSVTLHLLPNLVREDLAASAPSSPEYRPRRAFLHHYASQVQGILTVMAVL
ncbi:hypothetical protein [Brucella intermedia]|uniref:hypothetical protein n=1 Tax=Brucella intermedia TaxID=94625 RepID=UPI00224950AA|nr:hypothetical protein [Brucella intermedia]